MHEKCVRTRQGVPRQRGAHIGWLNKAGATREAAWGAQLQHEVKGDGMVLIQAQAHIIEGKLSI